VPNPSILNHSGKQISEKTEDTEFFAAPPPDLGQILSIDSTLKRSDRPMTPLMRMGISAVGVIIPILFALLIRAPIGVFFVLFLIGVGIAALIYFVCGFNHKCTFVGEEGIALYQLKGSRSAPIVEEKLLFKDVANLYTKETRHYNNGHYSSSTFEYQFVKFQDKPYKLDGSYKENKDGSLDEDYKNNDYLYVRAAETAWTSYFMAHVNQQFKQLGYVEFAMGGNPKAVRVGEGYLEFMGNDGTGTYVAVPDMRKISLSEGMFYFEHKDSTWWQGKGKYSFAYSTLPNARAFLICLDKLAGIRWS
jgi:hypothetical protein